MSKIERIVLHIGKRKTGSSSIQASLQGFNADGFRYADLPKPNHSRVMLGLIDRLMQREKRRAKDAVPADLDDRRGFRHRQIEEAIGDAPARTVLFSAESLEKVTNEEAASIVDFFARFTDRVEVIGFVRPPRSSQVSQFQERLKHGYHRARLPSPVYRETFEPFVRRLGAEAVKIVPFLPAQFVDGSLLKTFLSALGEPDIAVEEVRRNEGMSAAATKVLFAFNRMVADSSGNDNADAHMAVARRIARALPGEKLSLSDDCHPRGKLVDDVAWLKEVSGIDFSADLHRMNPDARAASARFEAELTAIPAGAGEQLSEYVRKRTGFAAGTMEEALRHLNAVTRPDSVGADIP